MQHDEPGSPVVFAREAELARLHGLLDHALCGSAAICFVTGEAGAGKSALLEAFAFEAKAQRPELVIAAGECNPHAGSEEPYLPFREILSDLTERDAHQSGPDRVQRPSGRFLEAARRAVAEHGPDLIDIFIPGGALITRVGAQAAQQIRQRKTSPPDTATEHSAIQQGHLFEQYTSVLCRLARRTPLLLFIDDLHWADEASLDLLFHLSRRLEAEPVLLVGAYRPVTALRESERNRLLTGKINEFKRHHGDVWIDLSRIDAERAMALTNSLVDAEPNRLGSGFRDALFQRTAGHPLFTVELLRHLKESHVLQRDSDGYWIADGPVSWEGLPARVEGIIEERMASLDPADVELLESASVLGDSFLAEVVAHMLEQSPRDVIKRLSGRLSRENGVVRAEGLERVADQRAARYQFCHNLFREYFYRSLDVIERSLQHESAALALEAFLGTAAQQQAAQLAWHYEAADQPLNAIRYHLAAGRQAQREYANAEASSHYRAVLKLLERIGDAELSAVEQAQLRRETSVSLGAVQHLRGRFEQSIEAFRQALELTDSADRIGRAELHRRLAGNLERQRRDQDAIAELEYAADLLGPPDEQAGESWWSVWIAINMDRVRLHYWRAEPDAMAPLLADLAEVIDRRGNAHQRCHFWTGQAMRGYRVERYWLSDNTVSAARNALAAAREAGNPLDLSTALFGVAFADLLRLRPEPAIIALEEALDIATRCGDRHLQARSLAYLTYAHRLAGDAAATLETLRAARPAAEEGAMHDYVGLAMATESWLALRAGDPEAAFQHASEALAYWKTHAARYPLQWTALLPLLAAAIAAEDWPVARTSIAKLLDREQARLPAELEKLLSDASRAATPQGEFEGRDAAGRAINLAHDLGYL